MLTNLSIGFWNIINLVSGTIDWIIFFSNPLSWKEENI